ncbi:MAG: bifunctional riboflavin kinase/FAD synthetase [Oscillospiraceae bacterium]|nr:bifunctional riboflavin kinase/FAD synthetase [Oscillospiraceae bacterium]
MDKKIYALGFFDGVHLGHQALLKECRRLAEQNGCAAAAVTFTTHPDGLVFGKAPALLNTTEDKARILSAFGMADVLALPFDETLMRTPWWEFLEALIALGGAGFVCGDDFRFGAKGEGTAEKLAAFCKERDLPCAIVPEQVLDGERISSSRIRACLEQGDLEQANRLLGHPMLLTGTVQTGKQLGRTLGFPTANLTFPEGLIVPRFGVYACGVSIDEKVHYAVANIGTRPTVDGEGVTIEVHLLDFDGDLYGKEVSVAFYKFLRPEKKFASLEELQREIQKNVLETRTLLEKTQ